MGTVVVGIIVAGVVALAVRSMVRDKKNGKSIQCGGVRSPAPGNAAIQRNGGLGGKDRQRAQSGHGLCAAIPVHPPPYPAD